MPAPLAHAHHEQLDLEIGGRLPLGENLQDPLLGISYSVGDPCGRSNQLIMYFIGILLIGCVEILGTIAV